MSGDIYEDDLDYCERCNGPHDLGDGPEMAALERIGLLERGEVYGQGHPDVVMSAMRDEIIFLLKAFNVVREMYIGITPVRDTPSYYDFNKNFEERMAEK